jgi:hypothetical protein
MNSTLFARSICVALLRLLAVAKALAEQAGSAIYPSLGLKVVKTEISIVRGITRKY